MHAISSRLYPGFPLLASLLPFLQTNALGAPLSAPLRSFDRNIGPLAIWKGGPGIVFMYKGADKGMRVRERGGQMEVIDDPTRADQ